MFRFNKNSLTLPNFYLYPKLVYKPTFLFPGSLDIVTRDEWKANTPVLIEPMNSPVPYVIIHHSYIPPACNTTSECIEAMQWMQDFHMVRY